ncbi:MAG TPA: NADP-dependent oxidoreductase [Gammaproteobacteria bacterium]|nr:NADP-dependent oxidoreductase [Gammaproteobacteria bacterium]
MKALQINSYGNQEVLILNENASKPIPGDNQVLIKPYAVSINPVDWKIQEGLVQHLVTLSFPFTLGMDFSGVVESKGKNVKNFNIGDEVYGMSNVFTGGTGALAEFFVADANAVAHKPTSLSHEQAAAFPLVGISALQALMEYMKLTKNQKILIHGGAGGIGSMAIQLAKLMGAHVATTAAQNNTAFVKALGADEIIDYQKQNFQEIVKDYDAVLDTLGGETNINSYKILKKGGILVSMLEQPNEELMKKYDVNAFVEFTDVTTDRLSQLSTLIDNNSIKIHLDKIFHFNDVKQALDYQQNGRPRGKVVVTLKD